MTIEPALIELLASVTGPLGTALALGFWWLRGRFDRLELVQRRHGKRLLRLERHTGIPVAVDDEPSTDVLAGAK